MLKRALHRQQSNREYNYSNKFTVQEMWLKQSILIYNIMIGV